MKKSKNISALLWVLLLVLFVGIGGVVIAVNGNTTANLTVSNSLPVVSGVVLHQGGSGGTSIGGSSATLTSGATTQLTATFTVSDNNGCEDIDSNATKTAAVLYRSNVAGGASCVASAANCIALTCTEDAGSCTAGGADLDATYTCSANVADYADPTDAGATNAASNWTVGVTPGDNGGAATGNLNTGTTFEISSLYALAVSSPLNYTSLALGANTGTTDQTVTVTNNGNRTLNPGVGGYGSSSGDGYAMVCTVGTIAVAYEKYDTSSGTAYASKTALVTDSTPATVSLALAPGAASTASVYWGMGLPATGVGGTCTGHIVFVAQ